MEIANRELAFPCRLDFIQRVGRFLDRNSVTVPESTSELGLFRFEDRCISLPYCCTHQIKHLARAHSLTSSSISGEASCSLFKSDHPEARRHTLHRGPVWIVASA